MIRTAMARPARFSLALAACSAVWAWCTPPAPAYGQIGLAVYTMNADGSDVKRIYHADKSSFGSPTWSHDGKKIAFDGGTHQAGFEAAHIFVLTLGEEKPIDVGPGNTPSFSPDDQQIAFFVPEQSKLDSKRGVWVMNADGKNREWIGEGERPRWSADGDQMVFIGRFEGFPSVYLYDMVSLKRTRILDRGYDGMIGADFSPDGSRLVFIGYKGGNVFSSNSKGEVAVVDAKVGAMPEAVCHGRVGWHPDWSPEGNKILFRIANDSGAEQLHILDLDGTGQAMPLPNQFGRHNSDATWSADGKQIVFTSDRG
jgi:Tol biopolymer transport system component